jgi:hypothetical protein
MQGHRVNSKAALTAPGDYYVDFGPDGTPAALWARLPGAGTQVRVPAPTWSISVDDAGAATVTPSIDSGDYHGFLTAGNWSSA